MPVNWIEETNVQVHSTAHKKILGTWHAYATSYTLNTLIYSDDDGVDINTTNYSSPGDFRDWYVWLNRDVYTTPYDPNNVPYHCSPFIYRFECNATSRGVWPTICTFTY